MTGANSPIVQDALQNRLGRPQRPSPALPQLNLARQPRQFQFLLRQLEVFGRHLCTTISAVFPSGVRSLERPRRKRTCMLYGTTSSTPLASSSILPIVAIPSETERTAVTNRYLHPSQQSQFQIDPNGNHHHSIQIARAPQPKHPQFSKRNSKAAICKSKVKKSVYKSLTYRNPTTE